MIIRNNLTSIEQKTNQQTWNALTKRQQNGFTVISSDDVIVKEQVVVNKAEPEKKADKPAKGKK
ncbi:MAG: hypothetical protein M3R27_08885 [Bacteroidota bacterium]|nr:hypothetical protein [Bacteroidota bacterium]